MFKNPARGHKVEEKKTYGVLSIYNEKTAMVQKYSEKKKRHVQRNKKKGGKRKRTIHVWLLGRMHIEERRTIEGRVAASAKAKIRKRSQNKTNVTPEKGDMPSANQTPRGYSTSSRHLWLVNYVERTARARLLWAILSLVLLVTFGHTTYFMP